MRSRWFRQPEQENISQIKDLNQLTRSFPNQNLRPQFKNLENYFPYYRKVRGDGNCFYRSFAFYYLRQSPLDKFQRLFNDIQMVCYNVPFTINKKQFRDLLKEGWQIFLKPIAAINQLRKKQDELQKIFNKSELFDILMILYLRSLNYIHIQKNSQKYLNFVPNELQNELNKIAKFQQESEGVELISLPYIMNWRMNIIFVNERDWQLVIEDKGTQNKNINLMFRPGHYDILYAEQFTSTPIHKITNTVNGQQFHSRIPKKSNISSFYSQKNKIEISFHNKSDQKIQKVQTLQVSQKLDTNRKNKQILKDQKINIESKYSDPRRGMKKDTPNIMVKQPSIYQPQKQTSNDFMLNRNSFSGAKGSSKQPIQKKQAVNEQFIKVHETLQRNDTNYYKVAFELIVVVLVLTITYKFFL